MNGTAAESPATPSSQTDVPASADDYSTTTAITITISIIMVSLYLIIHLSGQYTQVCLEAFLSLNQ